MKPSNLMLYPEPKKCSMGSEFIKVPELITVSGVCRKTLDIVFNGVLAAVVEHGNALVKCAAGGRIKNSPEEYVLELASKQIIIESPTQKGIVNGLRTFRQILRQFPEKIPCMRIEDYPSFAERGVMLDISRDRVPTMDTLKQLIDVLSEFKANRFQLYIEHSFAYIGHEEVWRNASPITPDEMRFLDAYCADRGISLCANQNCLGHFERWLKHPKYLPLAEIDSAWMGSGVCFLEPNTLAAGAESSLSLVRDILSQIIPCCSGTYVNIGCDEPWDLGCGKSKEKVGKLGKHRVFGEHVAAVAQMVIDRGKRPQFWVDADFANKRSEIPPLPPELMGLVWGYDGSTNFSTRIKSLTEAGHESWVCPGANGWRTYTGRTKMRRENLKTAATEGAECGAKGFLVTEWGDSGHRQQWPISLLGMAEGVFAAWSGKAPESASAAGLHLFNSGKTGEWIEALGRANENFTDRSGDSIFADSSLTFFDPSENGKLSEWEKTLSFLDRMEKTAPVGGSLIAKECRHALKAAKWAVDRAIIRRGKNPSHKDRQALAARMIDIIKEHKEFWLCRSRIGGLEDSCNNYKFLCRHW
jgi:hypothetical protein